MRVGLMASEAERRRAAELVCGDGDGDDGDLLHLGRPLFFFKKKIQSISGRLFRGGRKERWLASRFHADVAFLFFIAF